MKKQYLIVIGAVAVLGIAAFFAFRGGKPAATDTTTVQLSPAGTPAKPRPSAKKTAHRRVVAPKPPKPVLNLDDDEDDDDDEIKKTPEEKALAKRIEKALDDENLDEALACAKLALNCRIVDIRQAMVDTLGWFGEKALPELTPFLVDADEDVRESAQNEWSMAVADIEDDKQKIGTVELAMRVLNDEDVLEDISSEYIGVDEKLAVESLLRIIEGEGNSAQGIAKAKETYEFVTGDEFVDRAAAEKWIAEEYEPPDTEEENPNDIDPDVINVTK